MGGVASKMYVFLFLGLLLAAISPSRVYSQTQGGVMEAFFIPPMFLSRSKVQISGSGYLKDREEKHEMNISQRIKTHQDTRFYSFGLDYSDRFVTSFSDQPQAHPYLGIERWKKLQTTFGYSHDAFTPEGWGVEVQISSNSDRLFYSLQETNFSILGVKNLSKSKSSSWFGSVFLTSRPGFLEGIPLPGVMWVSHASRDFFAVLGVPFIFLKKNISELSEIQLKLLFPQSILVKHGLNIAPGYQLSQFLESDVDSYQRIHRESRKENVFFIERKVGLGLEVLFSKKIQAESKVSYVFRREQYESESTFSDHEKRSRLQSGLQFSMNAKFTF